MVARARMVMNLDMAAGFAFVVMVMLRSVEAATYTVGDTTGWNTPSNSAAYSTWASSHTFRVGDILVFNFQNGLHDVAVVSQADYTNCNTASPMQTLTTSPVSYTLNATGTDYFICTHDSHCQQGQKLAVTVGSASSAPTTSPPGTTSPPPPPPPPPRSSSARGAASMPVLFLLLVASCYTW